MTLKFHLDPKLKKTNTSIRMTKFALPVISFFILGLFFWFFSSKILAEYILRPMPSDPNTNQLVYINHSSSPKNSLTFGDIMNNSTGSSAPTNSGNLEKTQKLLSFLNQISKSGYSSNNTTIQQYNNFISPSPYIPIPTLISNVNSLTNNSQLTTNNRILGYYDTHPTPSPISEPPSPTPIFFATSQTNTENRNYSVGEINVNPVKTTYTIAILGDSMVDTLGDLSKLRSLLNTQYPNYSFALLNLGQGSTDLEYGLKRLTETTKYMDKIYPPVLSYNIDILVVESFAYNHWTSNQYDLNRQWLDFDKITKTVKDKSPNTRIVFAAAISPNNKVYGDGVLNWNADMKWTAAQTTKIYLQNMVNFATSQRFPLADAFHPSLDPNGNGLLKYINALDHLHPSNEGAQLFFEKIVEAVKTNKLLGM